MNALFRTVSRVMITAVVLCCLWAGSAAAGTPQSSPAEDQLISQGGTLTQRGSPREGRRGWFGRWWRGSPENLKNHEDVKAAFGPTELAASSTALVLADDDEVALATVVDADGYLVTKSSLVEEGRKVRCRFGDQPPRDATIVGRDDDYDLALIKVDGIELTPVTWRTKAVDAGTFVAAVDADGEVIGLGVVSTERRRVVGTGQGNPRRAWLGVSLGGGSGGTGVTEVREGEAARRAGMQTGDRILAIDGKVMKEMNDVMVEIGSRRPGDEVKIRVKRGAEDVEITATLGRPPKDASPQDQWGGGPFSARRDGFPDVITHDTVIRPEHCGGPLVDLDGNVVGVNIARALRVTTYAAPAETVQRLIKELKKS